jgi:hypothetical protein
MDTLQRVAWIGFFGGIIVALINNVGGITDILKHNDVLPNLTSSEPNPTSIVKIAFPLNTVQIQDTVSGTAKDIPEGKQLWILIYPKNALKYYPHQVDIKNDGSWKFMAQFGQEHNVGDKYDILAVLADKNASNNFATYINTAADNNWPGMENLLEGTDEITTITVIRE